MLRRTVGIPGLDSASLDICMLFQRSEVVDSYGKGRSAMILRCRVCDKIMRFGTFMERQRGDSTSST